MANSEVSIKLKDKDLALKTDKTPPPPPTAVGPKGEAQLEPELHTACCSFTEKSDSEWLWMTLNDVDSSFLHCENCKLILRHIETWWFLFCWETVSRAKSLDKRNVFTGFSLWRHRCRLRCSSLVKDHNMQLDIWLSLTYDSHMTYFADVFCLLSLSLEDLRGGVCSFFAQVKMMETAKDLPPVQDMLEKSKPILGYDLLDICLNGPEEKLEETRYCQPALFIGGLAGLEKLRVEKADAVDRASVMAGLSLGAGDTGTHEERMLHAPPGSTIRAPSAFIDVSTCFPNVFLHVSWGSTVFCHLPSVWRRSNSHASPNAKPGEYTALCAAGVMSFEDGLKLVKLRGEAMQEAATSLSCTVRGVRGVCGVRRVSVVRCAVRSGFSGISEYLGIRGFSQHFVGFSRILSLLSLVTVV